MKKLVLITGRTARQGVGLGKGKESEQYLTEINTAEMAKDDMEELGIKKGDRVEISSNAGTVFMLVREGKLDKGLIFIPYGEKANRLVDTPTNASGMPDSKGITVRVKPVVMKK